MGNNCGCDGRCSVFTKVVRSELDEAFSSVSKAISELTGAAFSQGYREGRNVMADVAELSSVGTPEDSSVDDLVDADAVALDAVLIQLQDIARRLEFVEEKLDEPNQS